MGAQTNGNMADPRQRQMTNEGMQMRGQGPEEQAMAERMQAQRGAPAGNTPTPGSGIAFGPGRSSRGDVDLRRLLQDRITSGK